MDKTSIGTNNASFILLRELELEINDIIGMKQNPNYKKSVALQHDIDARTISLVKTLQNFNDNNRDAIIHLPNSLDVMNLITFKKIILSKLKRNPLSKKLSNLQD